MIPGVLPPALCFCSSDSSILVDVPVSTASMYAVGTRLDKLVVVSALLMILAVTAVAASSFQNIV